MKDIEVTRTNSGLKIEFDHQELGYVSVDLTIFINGNLANGYVSTKMTDTQEAEILKFVSGQLADKLD